MGYRPLKNVITTLNKTMPKTAPKTPTTKNRQSPSQIGSAIPKKAETNQISKTRKSQQKAAKSSSKISLYFSCDQATLNDSLDFVKGAVPNKPSHPILGNILIIADRKEQLVHLIADNLQFGMQVSFEATVKRSGKMTLPKDILGQMVKRFGRGKLTIKCLIEKPEREGQEPSLKAVLKSSQTEQFEIAGMDASDFPSLPETDNKLMTLPARIVMAQLSGSLFAASNDETKRVLNGSHFRFKGDEKRGLNQIETWTTDGHRLALFTGSSQTESPLSEPVNFTVPLKVLKELERHLNPTDQLTIYYSGEKNSSGIVVFEWATKRLVSRTFAEQYPDCSAFVEPLKEQYCRHLTVERLALLGALERLAVLTDKAMKVVRLELDSAKGKVNLSIENEIGFGKAILDAQCVGESLTLAFNVHYLVEVAKAISSSDIRINLVNDETPALIAAGGTQTPGTPSVEGEYILAPVQLR